MSFKFSWNPNLINPSNFKEIASVLEAGLKRGPKPESVVGDFTVDDIQLGTVPPRLHMIEISELETDRFKAVFSMVYDGNASITLRTRIQANTLISHSNNAPRFTLPPFAPSLSSLIMPLQFTMYNFRLSGVITLVVSKKGVVLVFQDDPLESVKITSSLDSIPDAAARLKSEIEQELRLVFRDSIPEMLYQLTKNGGTNINTSPADVPVGDDKRDVNISLVPQPLPTAGPSQPTTFFDPASSSLFLSNPATALSNSDIVEPDSLPRYFVLDYQALAGLKSLKSENMTLSLSSKPLFDSNVALCTELPNKFTLDDINSKLLEHGLAVPDIDSFDDASSVSSQHSSTLSADYMEPPIAKSGRRRVIKLRDAFSKPVPAHNSSKSSPQPVSSSQPKSLQQQKAPFPKYHHSARKDRLSFSASNSLPVTPIQSPRLSQSSTPDGRSRLYSSSQPPPLSLSPIQKNSNPQSPQLSSLEDSQKPKSTPSEEVASYFYKAKPRAQSHSLSHSSNRPTVTNPKNRTSSSSHDSLNQHSNPRFQNQQHHSYTNNVHRQPYPTKPSSLTLPPKDICMIRNSDGSVELLENMPVPSYSQHNPPSYSSLGSRGSQKTGLKRVVIRENIHEYISEHKQPASSAKLAPAAPIVGEQHQTPAHFFLTKLG